MATTLDKYQQNNPLTGVARAFVDNNGGFEQAILVARKQIVEDTTQAGRLYWLNMVSYIERLSHIITPIQRANVTGLQIIAIELLTEVQRSIDKFDEQDRPPVEWLAILSEEVGEVSKEVVEFTFSDPEGVCTPNKLNYCRNMRTELVQVAAVAVNMIRSLERNELK